MKFSRDQWEWQKQQAILDRQYQASRDAISDQRWQKEFELSLRKANNNNTSNLLWSPEDLVVDDKETQKKNKYLEDLKDYNDR